MIKNTLNATNAIKVYYECNNQPIVLAELLVEIIKEFFFETIRIKEQLGYVVFCSFYKYETTCGIHFNIQSDISPLFLEDRIEHFIKLIMV